MSQAATNGVSHVSQIRPHACTHLAAKGYHRTKKELCKQPTTALLHNHGIVIVCWLSQQQRRERFVPVPCKHSADKCSASHMVYVPDTSLPAHSKVKYNEASFIGGLQDLTRKFQDFSCRRILVNLFCSQPQGGFTVLCEASNTLATHCSENLVKKHST